MLQSFFDRIREPSSWAGLGLIAAGLGDVAKINEAPQVADAANVVAQTLAVTPTWQGLILGLFGAIALFRREGRGR